jgi:dipeptidyl aminopeptidase/acylaminoacyl peptidase
MNARPRRLLVPLLAATLLLGACRTEVRPAAAAPEAQRSLTELRRAFRTRVRDTPEERSAAPTPPPGLFEKVAYPAPLGKNVAYVTPVKPGAKRPAVLWVQGGFNWSVDESGWQPAPRENDQSARAFREAGLVLMMPALRGGNDNPGDREYFLGEVDDVLAALAFLAARPDVDPERVYLGGHSTGATLALLVAASEPRVRGVLAFGPIDALEHYGETGTALDAASPAELRVRSPVHFMDRIRVPTLVVEGEERGNVFAFGALGRAAKGAPVSFVAVPGANHFDVLAPITEVLARRIARGEEGTRLSAAEARAAMQAGVAAD